MSLTTVRGFRDVPKSCQARGQVKLYEQPFVVQTAFVMLWLSAAVVMDQSTICCVNVPAKINIPVNEKQTTWPIFFPI